MLPHLQSGCDGLLDTGAGVGQGSGLLCSLHLLRASIQGHGLAPIGTTWLGVTLCRLRGMAALECGTTEVLWQRESSARSRTRRVERMR